MRNMMLCVVWFSTALLSFLCFPPVSSSFFIILIIFIFHVGDKNPAHFCEWGLWHPGRERSFHKESTRPRLEGAAHKPHQDYITAGRDEFFNSAQSSAQIHSHALRIKKTPGAEATMEKEWENWRIPAWQLTKVWNKKWTKKQVIRAEKFILRHRWISVILKESELVLEIQRQSNISRSHCPRWFLFVCSTLNKDHQHLKWQSQKSWTM